MLASIGTFIIGELLFWILYVVFVIVLWLLLLPIIVAVATPFFLLRAALHPSGFNKVMGIQFRKMLDVWMDLSIRLIPV